ncbi:hypothetical protein [Catellatospora sichuanensis]|uniref:hypothetical protein n=1 Tax=Catellatospora sichuanensis TaxID=1969805 RepID=UPI001181CF4A|nr:hypothetical protein [Catellatospora sichuanensis]
MTSTNKRVNKSPFESSASFMLAEFDVLHRRIEGLERERSQRSNSYVLIMGGVATIGVGVIGTRPQLLSSPAILAALVGLASLGVILFRQHVVLAAQIVVLYRRAGRIRTWFDGLDPGLRPYLPWTPGDDTPPFRDSKTYSTYAATDPLLTLGSAISFALGAYVAASQSNAAIWFAITVSVAAFLLSLLVFSRLLRHWTAGLEAVAQEPYNVHFPYLARISAHDESGHR